MTNNSPPTTSANTSSACRMVVSFGALASWLLHKAKRSCWRSSTKVTRGYRGWSVWLAPSSGGQESTGTWKPRWNCVTLARELASSPQLPQSSHGNFPSDPGHASTLTTRALPRAHVPRSCWRLLQVVGCESDEASDLKYYDIGSPFALCDARHPGTPRVRTTALCSRAWSLRTFFNKTASATILPLPTTLPQMGWRSAPCRHLKPSWRKKGLAGRSSLPIPLPVPHYPPCYYWYLAGPAAHGKATSLTVRPGATWPRRQGSSPTRAAES